MIPFTDAFRALTGHDPYQWQVRLYEHLVADEVPACCDVPTGLGKTAVILIWLIALAHSTSSGQRRGTLPGRLVYIVNRRTVVDQATDVVTEMRDRLLSPENPRWQEHGTALSGLAEALRELASVEGPPVAVSTLRGELADNEEWKADPCRPAMIIGTIDMIGSKLLFSGYGDGSYGRAHHAGLIGQDTLIVHDEAHLTPPFSQLLMALAEEQQKTGEPRRIRVMELSATARGGDDQALRLAPDDEQENPVRERLDAAKRLVVHEAENGAFVETLAELAWAHEQDCAKVLVYVRSPESAQKVVKAIQKRLDKEEKEQRVALLTGTIRGYERDELVVKHPVYRTLLHPDSPVASTVYLVSTSAGEVGIDLDAHHMVCDLTTLDSMIQRLGRVNRRGGEGRVAQIDVVVEDKEGGKATKERKPFEEAVDAAQALLGRLPKCDDQRHNASPRALRALLAGLSDNEKAQAFSPQPAVAPLTDILLDTWALTSVRGAMPGRPQVAAYLHGLTEDLPETFVAWRKEVSLLDVAGVDKDALHRWFAACRIESRERLRDREYRVKKALQTLLKTHRKKDGTWDCRVVLLDERGEAEWSHLSAITQKGFGLAHWTVILPVEAGGLGTQGTLDGKVCEPALDVGDKQEEGRWERWLFTQAGDMTRWQLLRSAAAEEAELEEGPPSPDANLREFARVTLQEPPDGADSDAQSRHLLSLVEPRRSAMEDPERARGAQTLGEHEADVARWAKRFAETLGLNNSLREALLIAARWHDRGKDRAVWQQAIHNAGYVPGDHSTALAKSGRLNMDWRMLGGYRHEFGSLHDIQDDADFQALADLQKDLVLHLVAAHHGWARPHFDPKARDTQHTTKDNEHLAHEVMRRYARVQQRFGRWGLAWLESLLRCADVAASTQTARATPEPQTEEDTS